MFSVAVERRNIWRILFQPGLKPSVELGIVNTGNARLSNEAIAMLRWGGGGVQSAN